MEMLDEHEWAELARLVEITSDAVAVCDDEGTILHVNRRLVDLMCSSRDAVVGLDIKDILFSASFERAEDHRLPFGVHGEESRLVLKLSDGSFVPVRVRAGGIPSAGSFPVPQRYLVAIQSVEEEYLHERQMRRALSELSVANKRLRGTLSVIMSTVGSDDMLGLLQTVLNQLADTLEASGAAMYIAEGGGFKLRGVSEGMECSYLPEYLPYGVGIPTYAVRQSRACRLSISQGSFDERSSSGMFTDLDNNSKHLLRIQDMPSYRSEIAIPVFYGTQVLGVLELGWMRSQTPQAYDVSVLEVICEYLSIQMVGLASSMRSRQTAALGRSLNVCRDLLYACAEDPIAASNEVSRELCHALSCHFCPVEFDAADKSFVVDFEGGSRVVLPAPPDELLYSTTVPSARFSARDSVFGESAFGSVSVGDLKRVGITRVEPTSNMGLWLDSHGLPCQGVYIDFGLRPSGSRGDVAALGSSIIPAGALQQVPLSVLLLRDGSQEPIDDVEYDFLVHLAHDFEIIFEGETQKREERHIAQALQVGMRNSLGEVPGIATDSIYSSATSSALVGGDFYTLIRLPDEQAVMILGDVSGKGVEAASMSALVKTALTAYAWEGAAPARMARSLNSMLMGFSRVETFVTAFIAKIDLKRGRASYCSAGHPPAMLVKPSASFGAVGPRSGEVELLSRQSGVIGAFESMVYETGTFSFAPGDMLFMYTDGAIEARNQEGGFFGEQRLRNALLAHADDGVEGICSTVLAELDRFTSSALDDDIAMVALRFLRGRDT